MTGEVLDSSAVQVEQAVRSGDGQARATGSFRHLHRIRGSQIVRLDIEGA